MIVTSDKIRIGLGRKWTGLGDLLGFLTILNHEPNKFQLVLSEHMKRFLPLFEGYDVIVDDSILPYNTHLNVSSNFNSLEHAYKIHLKNLGIDSENYIPKFRIDLFEKHSNCDFLYSSSIEEKKKYSNEVIFVSNCSKNGEKERGLSKKFLEEFILSNKSTLFHHFRIDGHFSFNAENVKEYSNIDLVSYALACNKIGKYVGLNTGDYHLAIAAGVEPKNTIVLMPSRFSLAKICIAQWIYPQTNVQIVKDD